jgi:tRNA G46 methylase TrmB
MLHFATDHEPYFEHAVTVISALPGFETAGAECREELHGLLTDFESKWLGQGKAVPHTAFVLQAQP